MFLNTSINMDNLTKDPYEGLSILEIKRLEYPRWGHLITGTILLLIGFFGFFENVMVLYTFAKSKQLRSPTNIFIMGLSIADFGMVLLGNPLAWLNTLNGSWFVGEFFCYWEGFVVYFLGLSALYLLVAVSVDRYIVIAKPLKAANITRRVAVLAVVGCYAGGLFWSILPFFGWSSYGLEAPGVFCGLHWEIPDISNKTYILFIFFFCFVFPLGAMIFSYYNVFMTVKSVSRNTVWDMKSRVARKNLRIEKKMLKTCIMMCLVYWLCWTPYSVVSFIQAFGDANAVPIALSAVPAVAAKSQVVWNPIIYVSTNKQFRNAFYKSIPFAGIRDSLIKKEEEKEKEPSSKESDIDDKNEATETQQLSKIKTITVLPAQDETHTKDAHIDGITRVVKTQAGNNPNAVAPAESTAPTKVEC